MQYNEIEKYVSKSSLVVEKSLKMESLIRRDVDEIELLLKSKFERGRAYTAIDNIRAKMINLIKLR